MAFYTSRLLFVIPAFLGLLAGMASPASAGANDDQDYTRSTALGIFERPAWLYNKPDHYAFSPLVSNSDPQTQHPSQWDGQDWDPHQWGPGWTPEIAIKKFFKARIFTGRYMGRNNIPVVELGPTFYKISDLDQRRTLKLLTDQANIFNHGFKVVHLVDWYTHDVIGIYTAKGMFLN
jgi:hypothetical protein